jgi:hypothetical protein
VFAHPSSAGEKSNDVHSNNDAILISLSPGSHWHPGVIAPASARLVQKAYRGWSTRRRLSFSTSPRISLDAGGNQELSSPARLSASPTKDETCCSRGGGPREQRSHDGAITRYRRRRGHFLSPNDLILGPGGIYLTDPARGQ